MILSLLLSGWPGLAHSAPRTVALSRGQTAPFTGTLIAPDYAVSIGKKAERCDFLIGLNTKRMKKLAAIDLEEAQDLHRIDMQTCADREKFLHNELEKSRRRSFWTHPYFVVPVTVVLTYGVLRAAKEL